MSDSAVVYSIIGSVRQLDGSAQREVLVVDPVAVSLADVLGGHRSGRGQGGLVEGRDVLGRVGQGGAGVGAVGGGVAARHQDEVVVVADGA